MMVIDGTDEEIVPCRRSALWWNIPVHDTPHHPYDLKINLEEGTAPMVSPIYLLLASELM